MNEDGGRRPVKLDTQAGVVLITASLASYRLPTMKLVQEYFEDDLLIVSGDRSPGGDVKLLDPSKLVSYPSRNLFLPKEILLQTIPWRQTMRAKTVVVDLNPRVVHVWLVLMLRRLLGRRTLVWGHAWPRNGAGSRSDILRGALRRLATGIITYTRTQADELTRMYPDKQIFPAPNALYAAAEIGAPEKPSSEHQRSIIYVGRLVAPKKPLTLLKAFNLISEEDPNLKLVIVGDGVELEELRTRILEYGLRSRVELPGHISDKDRLRSLYSTAYCSVSPGYAGLSITQSLSFGVPIVISRNEPHAPEIEAAVVGFNAAFFETDDPEDLARILRLACGASRGNMFASSTAIAKQCKDSYSIEVMAHGLIAALSETE